MKHLPITLIYSRFAIGIAIPIFSFFNLCHFGEIAISLLIYGLISDVFDGIIARRIQVSSPKLRSLDSSVDQVFYIGFAIATYIQCN